MDDAQHTHPVLACVRGMRAALKDVADVDPVYMPTPDKASALVELSRVLAAAEALRARLLANGTDIALDHGTRDAASWLAAAERGDYRSMRRALEFGRSLESAAVVSAAMAEGRLDATKARIILDALDALPDEVSDELRDRAEATLVEQAADLSPKALMRVARHLEAVIDPEAADAAEARALIREERSAWEKTILRIVDRYDGTARVTGVLPAPIAQRLRTYLEAYAQPRKLDGDRARPDQVTGRAFCDLLEHVDPGALPSHGGDATVVMVTIPLSQLRADLGAASLGGIDSDTRVSAADARRLACTAHLIPTVLGSRSQVLDLGRTQRLFSPAQRKALRVQHATCQVDGCDVPSTWCDAHHEDPWSAHGRTDLKNALLVCSHHHRRLHDPRYVTARSGTKVQVRLRR